MNLSRTAIENGLWSIRLRLMDHCDVDQAEQKIAPLAWYIRTGRASGEFIRLLLDAKPFMIARRLQAGGTYDEVIERIKKYLKYDSTN